MPTVAKGIVRRIVAEKQTGLDVLPPTSGGQVLRRVTSNIQESRQFHESNEIRTSQQESDGRQSVRGVSGMLSGELSPGSYADIMASLLRNIWTTASVTVTSSDISSDAVDTITTAGGDFLDVGNCFKAGMVVRMIGFSTATTNNNRNFMLVGVTTTTLTGFFLDNTELATETAGANIAITEVGRHVFMPESGQVYDYWSFEDSHPDIDESELFTNCAIKSIAVKLPPTGMATLDIDVLGLRMTQYSGADAPYFTSPTVQTTTRSTASANGRLIVDGSPVAIVTGMDLTCDGGHTVAGGVVGSNYDPDVVPGTFAVSGTLSVQLIGTTLRNKFFTESESSIVMCLTTSDLPTADFVTFMIPRVKFTGSEKDDGETGIVMNMPFRALENVDGTTTSSTIRTTIVIQDSTVV